MTQLNKRGATNNNVWTNKAGEIRSGNAALLEYYLILLIYEHAILTLLSCVANEIKRSEICLL